MVDRNVVAQAKDAGYARHAHYRPKPATGKPIGNAVAWLRVSLKIVRDFDERGLKESRKLASGDVTDVANAMKFWIFLGQAPIHCSKFGPRLPTTSGGLCPAKSWSEV